MRRAVVLLSVAACGRFGFNTELGDAPIAGVTDGTQPIDGALHDAPATPFDGALPIDGMMAMPSDGAVAMCSSPATPVCATDLGMALGTDLFVGSTDHGDDFATDCGGGGVADVAVSWTAPTAGRYVFDTRGSSFDTVLDAEGSCTGPLLACDNDDPTGGTTSALSLDLAACQQIVFVLDGQDVAGTAHFSATRKCPEADAASALGTIAVGSTIGTGDSYASPCGGGAVADVAVLWTPPTTGRYVIDTRGSAYDTILDVLPSCTGTPIACDNDDPTGPNTSALSLDLTGGQQVVLVVDGQDIGGAFTLRANRKCPGIAAASNLGVIAMGSSETTGDSYASTCGGGAVADVAVDWMAPATGRYVFDTIGSSFDTVLEIFTSCTSAVLACDNDDPTGGDTSAISIDLTAGEQLELVVDGQDNGGNYVLSANEKCPGNDLASKMGMAVATGTSVGKGDSYASPCGGGTVPDVAYTWTAPSTGMFTFDTHGSSYDTVIEAFTTCAAGTSLGRNNDDPAGGTASLLKLSLTQGEQIVIVVDGQDVGGDYTLNITSGTN